VLHRLHIKQSDVPLKGMYMLTIGLQCTSQSLLACCRAGTWYACQPQQHFLRC